MSKVGDSGRGYVGTNTWTNVQAARDRLRLHQERFEKLSSKIRVSQTCESAGFMRKGSVGQNVRTIHDVDD